MTVAVGSGPNRAIRGGSWRRGALGARAAYRGAGDPSYRVNSLGFRLMRRCS